MNKLTALYRRGVIALGSAIAAPAVFAQGETTNIDLSAATTQLSDMVDALKQWIVSNAPKVGIILGAALIIMLIFAAFRWVKKGTSKAS